MRVPVGWIGLAALVGALVWGALHRAAPRSPLLHEPLPELSVQDLQGRPASLDRWRGQVVVLNVWASWCPPCLTEMPSLERLHRQLGPEGLAVVGLSVDDDAREAREQLAEIGISFPSLHDPGGTRVFDQLAIDGVPTTFVIGRNGRVQEVYQGIAQYDTPRALDHFRGLLRP